MGKKLLFSVSVKDCEMQVFRGSGNGGQKKQKTSSGVRLIHHPSGARAESEEHREQFLNKKEAWNKLIQSKQFKTWHKIETSRLMGQPTVEEQVEKEMAPKNIKTEIKDEQGRWTTVSELPKEE